MAYLGLAVAILLLAFVIYRRDRLAVSARYILTGKTIAVENVSVQVQAYRERLHGGIEPVLKDEQIIHESRTGVDDTIRILHPGGDIYHIRYNVTWKKGK